MSKYSRGSESLDRGAWITSDGRIWWQLFRPVKWGPDDKPLDAPDDAVFKTSEQVKEMREQ